MNKCKFLLVLLLSVLIVAPCLARCSSCSRRSVTDDSDRNTIHVSAKVGENKTPAKRIGVKQHYALEARVVQVKAIGWLGGGRTSYGYRLRASVEGGRGDLTADYADYADWGGREGNR